MLLRSLRLLPPLEQLSTDVAARKKAKADAKAKTGATQERSPLDFIGELARSTSDLFKGLGGDERAAR